MREREREREKITFSLTSVGAMIDIARPSLSARPTRPNIHIYREREVKRETKRE